MLSSGQIAALDVFKIAVNRTFYYHRSHDGTNDATLTLEFEKGETYIHGTVQTLDELEYAVARLIATARKEVGHGRVAGTELART